MTWRDREREYRKQHAELERLACEAADREANPELYEQAEIPAIWNRGDLWEGDQERDLGRHGK